MSGGLRKVLIAPEIISEFLTTGRDHSLQVVSGLPEGARLVAVEVPPRPYVYGPERHTLVAVFEHPTWEASPDGEVPELMVTFRKVQR